MSEKTINFLRGVPADEALAHLITPIAQGYEKAIRQHGTDVLQYGHFCGFSPLRDIIAERHGVDPERVIVGNGGLEVISLFFKSLPRESAIIIEQATYDRVVLDAMQYGHKLIGVKLTEHGIDLEQLEEVVARTSPRVFYGIPFHQNPTGINYSVENRKAVERICRQNDMLCVWDVCYQDLRYDGKSNDPIEVTDQGPILTSSFTKTISPGTKCGYAIVPLDYARRMAPVIANTRINPNLPTQAFIADFIRSGQYQDYLGYLRKLYKPRMDALNDALKRSFAGAYPQEVTGGFFSTLTLEKITGEKEAAFIESAAKAGVGIAAAWDAIAPNFKDEARRKGIFIRLTFPAFAPENIEWGLAKLCDIAGLFG